MTFIGAGLCTFVGYAEFNCGANQKKVNGVIMKIAIRMFVFMAALVMTVPSALPIQAQTTSTMGTQKFDGPFPCWPCATDQMR
jgi:hypothetical protein